MIRQTLSLLCACALVPACGDNQKTGAAPDGGAPRGPDGSVADAPAGDAPGPIADAQVDAPTADGPASGSSSPMPTPLLDYAFEDVGATVSDSSGHAFDGALTGDPGTIWAAGRNGNGLALQNSGPATEYVAIPSGVFAGASDYSIAFWLKLNSEPNWARVYDIGNAPPGSSATRYIFFSPTGFVSPDGGTTFIEGLHADSFTGSGSAGFTDNIIDTETMIPAGVWKHVVVTSTGATRTLWVDGFPAATETGASGNFPASELEPLTGESWLGMSRFGDPGLDGTIDDFQIYGSALGDDEIAQLALPQRDYAYWRFNEGTGTTAADQSSYANTATLATGVTWDADGRLDGAVALPGGAGKDGSGNIIDGPSLDFGADPFADCTNQLTIAAWVKLASLDPWAQLLEITTDVGVTGEAWIDLVPFDGGAPHFAMITPTAQNLDLVGSTNPFDDGTGHSDGKWHHLAVTVAPNVADSTKSDVVLYADGAVIGTATTAAYVSAFSSAASPAPMTHFWLGRSRFGDPYLHGSIDELRLSCRAFTAGEIENLAARPN